MGDPPPLKRKIATINGLRDFRAFGTIADSWSIFFSIHLGVQSIVHLNAQIQLFFKKSFMWFQWFRGSN